MTTSQRMNRRMPKLRISLITLIVAVNVAGVLVWSNVQLYRHDRLEWTSKLKKAVVDAIFGVQPEPEEPVVEDPTVDFEYMEVEEYIYTDLASREKYREMEYKREQARLKKIRTIKYAAISAGILLGFVAAIEFSVRKLQRPMEPQE